ncbi:MAG: T9SS C-terminal target domain-containing protein [Chitinophagia bacterium]|nr:T9SS C-terminal target domain-containing protein [Chitinophagia bacterium]
MMKTLLVALLVAASLCLLPAGRVQAATDTLRLMSYNVLYYGDSPACQAPHDSLHGYLKTIVSYASPDVLGLVKVEAFPTYAGDHNGTGPTGWADSILRYALNAAFIGRYAACPVTNAAHAGDVQVLFYDQHKLGYLGMPASYVNINDFDTYKFYYKTPLLGSGYDTVFLYVTLNHTESGSGSGSESARQAQINGEMNQLQGLFTGLPNLVNMGDFNFHRSAEAAYQRLVNPTNSAFKMYDPLFGIDAVYTYPADWDTNPTSYAASLTTSTRLGSLPNSCGTTGGGKSWYDHIFVSETIKNNTLGLQYLPRSYTTLGNDGLRVGKNINDTPTNTAAPANVIYALFHMSNKYPVMASLLVTPARTSVSGLNEAKPVINVENPVTQQLLRLHCTQHSQLPGEITVTVYDAAGKLLTSSTVPAEGAQTLPFIAAPGTYILTIAQNGQTFVRQLIIQQ